MANIPQNVPGDIKSYAGYSKPIEKPSPIPAGTPMPADTSLEALFKGVGQMLTNVTTAADTIIKGDIKDNLYKDLDAERGKFTSELSQYSKDIGGIGQPGTAKSNPDQNNGGEDGDEEVPEEITSLPDQVSNLAAARQGGKISPTQYWLAIDNIAKDYRSRYAGHRDYIDQTISSITGHNPANAYMSSIMSDLNYSLRATAQKVDPTVKQAQAAVVAFAKEGKIPPAQLDEMWAQTTTNPVKVIGALNTIMAPKYEYEKSKLDLMIREGKLDDATLTAKQVIPQTVTNYISAHINGSIEFGGETVQSLQRKAAEAVLDPSKADPQQIQIGGMKLMMLRQQSEAEMRTWLNEPKGPNGESRAQVAAGRNVDAGQYVNDLLKARYAQFDAMVKNYVGKDPALASYQAELIQAQATNDQYNALKTDFGVHLRMMNLLQKYPEDMKEYMKTILTKDYGNANVNVFVKEMMANFMTGRSQGKLVSIDEAIKKAQAAGVTDPRVYSDFAKFGEQIMNPSLSQEAKVNIAASMFNKGNFGFLSNFKEDKVVVGDDGVYRMAPGKYAVWQTYTTPAFAAEIKKIAAKNPEVGMWYQDWVQSGFGSDVFGPQIQNLNKIMADPRVTITYNNVSNQFNIPEQVGEDFYSRMASRTQRQSGVTDQTTEAIRLLNLGLRGMANEAETRGVTDPAQMQGYLLGQLKGLGIVPPEPRVRPDPKTVAEQLINAFVAGARQFSPVQGGNKKEKK